MRLQLETLLDMVDVFDKFFSPKSICVIGASSTTGKPGNVVVKNIKVIRLENVVKIGALFISAGLIMSFAYRLTLLAD